MSDQPYCASACIAKQLNRRIAELEKVIIAHRDIWNDSDIDDRSWEEGVVKTRKELFDAV